MAELWMASVGSRWSAGNATLRNSKNVLINAAGTVSIERGSMPILGTADKARHLTRPRKSEFREIDTGVSRPGTGHNYGCLFFHCIFNEAGAIGVLSDRRVGRVSAEARCETPHAPTAATAIVVYNGQAPATSLSALRAPQFWRCFCTGMTVSA